MKTSHNSQESDKSLPISRMTHYFCKQKSFRKTLTWVVFSLLLFWNTPLSSCEPTYEWHDPVTNERHVCQQCPPGTFVAQDCTKDRPTQCQACPSLYYTQYWNYLDKCLYCSNICSSLEVEALPCDATHDRVCQCKAGYYLDYSSDLCLPHTVCPLGSVVIQAGTPHKDTQCAECPPGTFSNSSTGICQPHTNCSEHGLKLTVPGNQFHDALCTDCHLNQTNGTLEGFEASGTPDCEQAFIDLAVYRTSSPERLLFLKSVLQEAMPKQDRRNQHQLRAEIYSYLTRIRNTPTEASAAKKLLSAFQKLLLHRKKKRLFLRFWNQMHAPQLEPGKAKDGP